MERKQARTSNIKARALRLLTVKNRTAAELRQRLLKDGYLETDVEAVISWLLDLGYLNDRLTAAALVETRCRFRPKGIKGLDYELRQKGVAEEIIQEVMISKEDERQLAISLAEKRLKTMANLPLKTKQRRIIGLLNRRGFSWDVIRYVLDRLLGSSLDTDL
ncbi:MAG: regulatory protein RecX [Firmicutes bacterium]|nr:regulatory protein RecX [Bacillota bacterium]